MHEEGGHLGHADLDGIAWQNIRARGKDVVECAVQVVRGDRVAEQSRQPEAEVTGVDGDDDIAFVIDHILQWGQRIAPLAQHRIVDQSLFAPQRAAVERHAHVVAARLRAVGGLPLEQQRGVGAVGSGHLNFSRCC